jgi:hypothetical protein
MSVRYAARALAQLDAARIARAWAVLLDRLGYTRYVAQGGDVGAAVTDAMGRPRPNPTCDYLAYTLV